MTFHIVTLFRDLIEPYLNGSILGRAQEDGKFSVKFHNPRDATTDKHNTARPTERPARQSRTGGHQSFGRVDDKPFGGGPGMVMKIEPLVRTVEDVLAVLNGKTTATDRTIRTKIVLLSPVGKQFSQTEARAWARDFDNIVLIAGHYEGVDARLKEIFDVLEISVGPYVLSGGELPAAIIVDAVARHIPSVLGDEASCEETRGLGIPQYTRPEIFTWKGNEYPVPSVLLSGNHKEIEKWRNAQIKPVDNQNLTL